MNTKMFAPIALTPVLSFSSANNNVRYTGLNVSVFHLTAEAMASIGYKELADADSKGKGYFYVLDVACFTALDTLVESRSGASVTTMTRHGVGYRVAVVALELEAKFSTSLAAVAASAEMKSKSTSLQIDVFGVERKSNVVGELANISFGSMNPDMLKKIGAANEILANYLDRNIQDATPHAIAQAVRIDPFYSEPAAPKHRVISHHYALENLAAGRTLADSLARLSENAAYRNDVRPVLVRAVYAELGPIGRSDAQEPTQEMRKKATALLNQGGR